MLYSPYIVRAVSMEVKQNLLEFRATLLPLLAEVDTWILHCGNAALPAPFDVRLAVEQYEALTIRRLELRSWIAEIATALPDDGLVEMTPCGGQTLGGIIFPTPGITISLQGMVIPSTGMTIKRGASIPTTGLLIPS